MARGMAQGGFLYLKGNPGLVPLRLWTVVRRANRVQTGRRKAAGGGGGTKTSGSPPV